MIRFGPTEVIPKRSEGSRVDNGWLVQPEAVSDFVSFE
jgi:hypothetical protein